MLKSPRVLMAIVAIVLPAVAFGGQLIPTEDLIFESVTLLPKRCDTMHHVQTCDNYHVVGTGGGGFSEIVLEAGKTLVLNDQEYQIRSVSEGLWLENGMVLEARGETTDLLDASGEGWQEIYPAAGRSHRVLDWSDVDGDGVIGAADLLSLEGDREVKVVDVRFLVRVRPTT